MPEDRNLLYKNFERGSGGPAPACCFPLWGREGVTLTNSPEGTTNDFSKAEFSVLQETGHAVPKRTRQRIADGRIPGAAGSSPPGSEKG